MTTNLCDWHDHEYAIDVEEDGLPGCPHCGNLLSVKDCLGCGQTFVDWSYGGFDDVIAGPYVSESGDLYCQRCGPYYDEEYERMIDEEAGAWGFYDAPWEIIITDGQ